MFPFARRGSLYGGIFLPAAKEATEGETIRSLPPPESLFIPLTPKARLVSSIGQTISRGDCLAEEGPRRFFAPVHGRVVGQTRVDTALHRQAPALEFAVLERALEPPDAGLANETGVPGQDQILDALALCHQEPHQYPADCARAGIAEAIRRGAKNLIINGLESEPILTAEHRLLKEYATLIAWSMRCLHDILKCRRTYLVLDSAHEELIRHYRRALRRSPIRILALRNRHPQGYAPLLVQAVLGTEIPLGKSDLDLDTAVLSISSLFHFGRALQDKAPATARVITVSGDAIEKPGNYWVLNGTPVKHVLKCAGLRTKVQRLIAGGPMTGKCIPDERGVLTMDCPALLAFSERSVDQRIPTSCVHCGWCLEACPVNLEPATLFVAIELNRRDKLKSLHLDACIECGLCSYVCPTALPLAASIARRKKLGGTADG